MEKNKSERRTCVFLFMWEQKMDILMQKQANFSPFFFMCFSNLFNESFQCGCVLYTTLSKSLIPCYLYSLVVLMLFLSLVFLMYSISIILRVIGHTLIIHIKIEWNNARYAIVSVRYENYNVTNQDQTRITTRAYTYVNEYG